MFVKTLPMMRAVSSLSASTFGECGAGSPLHAYKTRLLRGGSLPVPKGEKQDRSRQEAVGVRLTCPSSS